MDNAEKTKKHIRTLLTIIRVLSSNIILIISSIVLHELGHVLGAVALGIPLSSLTLTWFGLNPGFIVSSNLTEEKILLLRYSGGFIAGSILLSGYSVWLIRRRPTGVRRYIHASWWFWGFMFSSAVYQFFNGYIEGTHFTEYATDPAFLNVPLASIMVTSFLLHAGLTYLLKQTGKFLSGTPD